MKVANLKRIVTKVAAASALAAAVLFAVPNKAAAQSFSVGVRFGRPIYGPAYGPVYRHDLYEERRREEFFRHERWVREHEFRRGYAPGYTFYGR